MVSKVHTGLLYASGFVFPLGLFLAHRLHKDQGAVKTDRRLHIAYFGYSAAVLLAYTLAEMQRNNVAKEMTSKYLSYATNDHLRVMAGEGVANRGAVYSGAQPNQFSSASLMA